MKIKDDAYGRLKYTYETRISCAVFEVELFILSFSDLFDFILHRFGRLQIHLVNLSWILAFYFCTMNQSSYDYQVISSTLLRINRLTARVIILVPLNCLHLVCVSISTSLYQFSLISAFMYSIPPFFLFFSQFLSFSFLFSCYIYVSLLLSSYSSLAVRLYLSISRSTSEQPQRRYNLHKTLRPYEVSANFEIYSHRVYRHRAKGSAIVNVIALQPPFDSVTLRGKVNCSS